MLASIIAVALLSTTTAFGAVQNKRQATDDAQFTAAADQLISNYIPASVLPVLESLVSSAASAAKVTGEPLSLVYDGLIAQSVPGWFASAIPSEWTKQIAALESNIDALRPTPASGSGGTATPFVVVITTTDAEGNTITTSRTPLVSAPSTTSVDLGGVYSTVTTEVIGGVTSVYTTAVSKITSVAGDAGSVYSSVTTEVIDGVTSVYTTAVSKITSVAGDAASVYSSLTTEVVDGVTSIYSTAVSKITSVAGEASSGVDTAISKLSTAATGASGIVDSATSTGGAALATAVSGAAAGVIGMVGLMIAL